MSVFKVLAEDLETGKQKEFFVDNKSLRVSDVEFPYGGVVVPEFEGFQSKKPPYSDVRIQLGLKCNFSCGYCAQAALPEEPQFNIRDLDDFIDKFLALPLSQYARIQFWGGEPLVYWKHIKRITERLHEVRKDLVPSIITNGSLITKDKVDFLVEHGFYLSISHDGVGQSVRGVDPIDTNYDAIKYVVEKLAPLGRFSFNSMLSKENPSRLAIIDYFKGRFPTVCLPSGEMGFLKSTGEDNERFIDLTVAEHFEFRRNLWAEMRFHSVVHERCRSQAAQASSVPANSHLNASRGVGSNHNYHELNYMKCGIDQPNQIAIDLKGNILTCHNINASSVDKEGNTRVIGDVFSEEAPKLANVKHWTQRKHCGDCPVMNTCKGSCMMLEGREWDLTCEIEYTDKITLFSVGFEQLTGYVPIEILDESLPLNRRDIWGSRYDWSAIPEVKVKKVIPIIAK